MKFLTLAAVVALAVSQVTLAAPSASGAPLERGLWKVFGEVFLLQGLDKLFAEFCITQLEYMEKEFGGLDMIAHPEKFLSASTFDKSKPAPEEICEKVSSTKSTFENIFSTEVKAISDRHINPQVKEYLKGVSYAKIPCVTTLSLGLAQLYCEEM